MHAISDNAVSQQSLAAHSIATYRAGETVLSAASTIGREEASGIPRYKRYQIASRRHPPNTDGSHGGATTDAVS